MISFSKPRDSLLPPSVSLSRRRPGKPRTDIDMNAVAMDTQQRVRNKGSFSDAGDAQKCEDTLQDGSLVDNRGPAKRGNITGNMDEVSSLQPRDVAPAASSITLPNLSKPQHLSLLFLAFIQQRCKAQSLESLNSGRNVDERLLENDPEVISLAEKLFATATEGVASITGLTEEFTGTKGGQIRDDVGASFDQFLSQIAAKEVCGLESRSSSLEERVTARRAFGSFAQSTVPGNSSISSFIRRDGKSFFQAESEYKNSYEEISLLGRGAFGSVHKVKSFLDGQHYAIKKIVLTSKRLQSCRTAGEIESLLAEVRTLAKLGHTNVVRYYHAWLQSGIASQLKAENNEGNPSVRMIEGFDTATMYDYYTDRIEELQELTQDGSLDRQDIVFGYSSAQIIKTDIPQSQRDEDQEVEIIQRDFADISLAKQEEMQSFTPYVGPDITLCIKMSLHPLTLSKFLSWDAPKPDEDAQYRHCFHIRPSLEILRGILDGINYLHHHKVVHRDLKPDNIFLSVDVGSVHTLTGCVDIATCPKCSHGEESQHVYITPCIGDFGLVAELKEGTKNTDESKSLNSLPTTLTSLQPKPVGTLFYRPPFMPDNEPIICPKLDVYSLGVIAFELVRKFDTKSERAIVLNNLRNGILPVDFETHAMADGIKSMVCADRDKRWDCSTVREWIKALEHSSEI